MAKFIITIIALLSLLSGQAQVVWGVNNSRTDVRDDAGLQGNAGALSGFFQSASPVNYPTGATNWWHLLDVRHSTTTNNYAMQFSGSFFDQQLWFRKTNNSPTQPWSRIITESGSQAVIGTGTGAAGTMRLLDESNIYSNLLFGSLASANNRSGLMLQSNGSITQAINGNPAAGFSFRWLVANGTVSYFDDSNEKMRLTTDGRLGIGTNSPGPYKLAVEGTIGARKIKVTQVTPWADYVFNDNYRLRSLAEIESFIKNNGHLPEVPSAEEVKKDGVDLGDNQVLLLKKIEELTLYVIEQNKKIDQQDKRIKKLENKAGKRVTI